MQGTLEHRSPHISDRRAWSHHGNLRHHQQLKSISIEPGQVTNPFPSAQFNVPASLTCSQDPRSCSLDPPVAITIFCAQYCALRRSGRRLAVNVQTTRDFEAGHRLPASAIGSASESRCVHITQSSDINFSDPTQD
jgi:hypothetical protein